LDGVCLLTFISAAFVRITCKGAGRRAAEVRGNLEGGETAAGVDG